jgi:hypothetical protein
MFCGNWRKFIAAKQGNIQAEMKAQQENLQRRPPSAAASTKHIRTNWTAKSLRRSGRKNSEGQLEEQQMLKAMQGLREASSDNLLNAEKNLGTRE